jgi:hypothetical protein
MSSADLIALRKKAEDAVADMAEGPLKVKAFEVILGALLATPQAAAVVETKQVSSQSNQTESPSSLAERIGMLADTGLFAQPKSLAEIQGALAQNGWHYPQNNLSGPLIRLVRQRRLRRLQVAEGGKRVWKYSLP